MWKHCSDICHLHRWASTCVMDSGFYGIMFVSNVVRQVKHNTCFSQSDLFKWTLRAELSARAWLYCSDLQADALTHMMVSSSVCLAAEFWCAGFTCTEFDSPSGSEYLCLRNEINWTWLFFIFLSIMPYHSFELCPDNEQNCHFPL